LALSCIMTCYFYILTGLTWSIVLLFLSCFLMAPKCHFL
jgi:hypothetical protein